ncbi:hypothetical protein OHA72_58400 [Dactylosporangium sp. NBC_01737]|uniref:hypothetical protein n=1 Tax=Dactylosporangium sp. NBC_01737 TaxID=2975959 RepID=UPI002E11151E|nr:hypothetical protein OHA72_58400 [Dactylosporangium sp. NBC_01737]
MTRSTGWLLALAALMLLGCIGPFADTFDEAVQDTPADYDECCVGADRATLEKLAGVPVTPVTGGDLDTLRVDAVVTTRQLDAATEKDTAWNKDGDGLIANDDTHEYVLALVTRLPAGDPKIRPVTTVIVSTRLADAWRIVCPAADPSGRSPAPCAVPTRHGSAPLVDSQDGKPITSAIVAVRVPVGQVVLLTAGDPKQGGAAVDLRTGRAVKIPARA